MKYCHHFRNILLFAAACFLSSFVRYVWPDVSLHKQTRILMGTFCEIQVYHADSSRAQKAVTEALEEMERVDGLLSNYNPDSELSRLNENASQSPVPISSEMFDFLDQCRILHRRTLGVFDPTVGPLVRAWGLFSSEPAIPSEGEIALARSKIGFSKILLDEAEGTVFFSSPGMEVDSRGVGKGYAVDLAVRVLRRRGIDAALVSAGGSTIYALGHPPDRENWRVGIKNSANPRQAHSIVHLRDSSVSTSGVTGRMVQIGSHRYSHIFDPRSGEPVEGIYQVSVVAPIATDSEAFTKAAFILPREAIERLFGQRMNVHVLRVEEGCNGQGVVWKTPWSSSVFNRGDTKWEKNLEQD